MIAEEMHCTVTEAKARVTPQEFLDKLTFWETHPPMRDHLNICIAQVSQVIANVNRGRRQKAKVISDFMIDYKKARMGTKQERLDKARRILGGLAKKKG